MLPRPPSRLPRHTRMAVRSVVNNSTRREVRVASRHFLYLKVVREGRLELPLCFQSWILSPVRLPIPPLSHLLKKKGIQASDLGRLNLEDKLCIQYSLGVNGRTQYPNPLSPSIKDKTDNVNLIGCQVKYAKSPSYKLKKKVGFYIKIGCVSESCK